MLFRSVEDLEKKDKIVHKKSTFDHPLDSKLKSLEELEEKITVANFESIQKETQEKKKKKKTMEAENNFQLQIQSEDKGALGEEMLSKYLQQTTVFAQNCHCRDDTKEKLENEEEICPKRSIETEEINATQKEEKEKSDRLATVIQENKQEGTAKKRDQHNKENAAQSTPIREDFIPDNQLEMKREILSFQENEVENVTANEAGGHYNLEEKTNSNSFEIALGFDRLETKALPKSDIFEKKETLAKRTDTNQNGKERQLAWIVASGEVKKSEFKQKVLNLSEKLKRLCVSMGFTKSVELFTKECPEGFTTVVLLNDRAIGHSVNYDLDCSKIEALKCALDWLIGLTTSG